MISDGKRWAWRFGLVATAFAGGAVTARIGHATGSRETPYEPLSQLARVLVRIENDYVDPVERQRLLNGAIRGMVAELDPHSAYMTPSEFAQFHEDTEGSFGGVGVEVDFRDGRVIVLALVPGAPAAKGGLRAGDEIIAIDGKPLRGVEAEAIVRTMRGAPGSRVSVTLKRHADGSSTTVELVREQVRVRSVEARRLSGNVGYLRIRQFQSGTHAEFVEAVAALHRADAAPLAGVVLDLRNNPGGLVDEAEAVADEFLTEGTIYTTRHRARVVEDVRARPGGVLATLPMAVLVNEYSASSSELLAGALQDNGRGAVVGATTFGKGSVQSILELPGHAGLRLTTMRYYSPRGRAIQARGVEPDVRIRYEDEANTAVPIPRERTLEGALEGEPGTTTSRAREEVTAPRRPEPIPIEDVALDPSKGPDVALAIAHRRALGGGSSR